MRMVLISPISRIAWEGSVGLLEEECHWEWALEFQNPMQGPVCLSAFNLWVRCEFSAVATVPHLSAYHHGLHHDGQGQTL